MMGPDCGTAIINGVPLAFANAVTRGNIGVIGASGTGIQEVTSLITRNGFGVSQAIGVGGRDLQEEVGGITTLMAIDALDADLSTSHIVIISKPPSKIIAEKILGRVKKSKKTFTVCFLGLENQSSITNVNFVASLKEAAESAMQQRIPSTESEQDTMIRKLPNTSGVVHGLFSGGTLCLEAQIIFKNSNISVSSNVPLSDFLSIDNNKAGHLFLDLGSDEYTNGKPHPMIDPSVRDDLFVEALSNSDVSMVLFDVVIGFGSHSDPAGHVAAIIKKFNHSNKVMISSVTGTDNDPQSYILQKQILESAGVLVASSNFDAANIAVKYLNTFV